MGDLGGADAEGVSTEGAMARGMAVAAYDQQAGERKALLGTDHVHDSLARIRKPKQGDAVLGGVFLEGTHHARDLGIVDDAPRAARRDIMIGDSEGETWLGDPRAARLELAESVERSLMHVMAVDPQQRLAVIAPHDLVGRPQLVEQGQRLAHGGSKGTKRRGAVSPI